MARSVETLGVDPRTRIKLFGAKEKARINECDVRFSAITQISFFPSKKESWCEEGVDDGFTPPPPLPEYMAPTERLKLRRQMATAAGKSRFRFYFSWN